jgi:hypothetical protein
MSQLSESEKQDHMLAVRFLAVRMRYRGTRCHVGLLDS